MNILLIDLSSIAHPLYHISASDPDPNATSIKTVERVRALASGQPHVGVCVEGGRSFRKDIDATYKQNRPESDAALQHQIALAIDVLRADGFPILQAPGFEADDAIATACAKLPSHDIVIASADKDLIQLIWNGVGSITVKSLKDGSLIDRDAVAAKFGVYPEQFLDFLALCGDASDNIKGAKGIGTVTAAKLLKEHGSIEGILAKKEQQTIAMRAALDDFAPRLESVRALLRLRTDAPIDIESILKERVPLDVAEFGAEEMAPDEEVSPANVLPVAAATVGADVKAEPSAPVQLAARANGTFTLQADTDPAPIEWERQLEPRNMQQMKSLAADLFASRLFSAYGHPAGVLSTILAGRELGLPAMASLRAMDIIDGKPCFKADLIRALVLRSDKIEYFRCTERTDERATFIAKRNGDPEIKLTFTIEDARRAWSKGDEAWTKSGYGKNPADMLVARAGAKLARLVAPDIAHGLYVREELE
jgi:DNA polymerase-1